MYKRQAKHPDSEQKFVVIVRDKEDKSADVVLPAGADVYKRQGEYGRLGWSPEFLGWTPRMQDGYHLHRVGGQMFYAGAPMVAERPDLSLIHTRCV